MTKIGSFQRNWLLCLLLPNTWFSNLNNCNGTVDMSTFAQNRSPSPWALILKLHVESLCCESRWEGFEQTTVRNRMRYNKARSAVHENSLLQIMIEIIMMLLGPNCKYPYYQKSSRKSAKHRDRPKNPKAFQKSCSHHSANIPELLSIYVISWANWNYVLRMLW